MLSGDARLSSGVVAGDLNPGSACTRLSELRGRLGGMCGRYASTRDPGDLVDEFEIEQVADDLEPIGANYNVAPTNSVYAVVERLPRNDDGKVLEQADGVRQLRVVT